MNAELAAALVGGAAGLGTGVVGSLVAPWVNWKIEKWRSEIEAKRAAVESWRLGLASWEALDGNSQGSIRSEPWFQSLSPYLTTQVQKVIADAEMVRPMTVKVTPPLTAVDPRDRRARIVSDEINRIAKQWSVI